MLLSFEVGENKYVIDEANKRYMLLPLNGNLLWGEWHPFLDFEDTGTSIRLSRPGKVSISAQYEYA